MDSVVGRKIFFPLTKRKSRSNDKAANLAKAGINKKYTIKEIKTSDEELKKFLFTLGCYEGENVTVLSILGENYVISIKDARYSINKDLAEAIAI